MVGPMVLVKIYFLGGLLLVGAGLWLAEREQSGLLVTGGVLALALGLLQAYVALPVRLKVVLSLGYFVGIGGLLSGHAAAIRGGSLLSILVLLAQMVGVVRFPGTAKRS